MTTARRTRRPGAAGAVAALAVAMALVAGACGAPIAANPPAALPSAPPTPAPPAIGIDPRPIAFPVDDAPHDRLTEWWYYTGHLRDRASGDRFGFEFVVFRAERGGFPISWASHLALTDETGNRFLYAQRTELGRQVDESPRDPSGSEQTFALQVTGTPAGNPASGANPPWSMKRDEGRVVNGAPQSGAGDRLTAALSTSEAHVAGGAFAIDLRLTDGPVVLHNGNGWIDFGPAGGSYYYSRPRMPATGTVTLDGRRMDVSGEAWFDHQWGDFIAVGGGGWDWFAVNLAEGTDLTLSLVRDANGGYPLIYGTLRRPNGTVIHLPADTFKVAVLGQWTSPATGTTYPSGWRVDVPGEGLAIDLRPTVADQELDTRPTTGVIYWEGSQVVRATKDGRDVAGDAYVELTGYAHGSSAPPSSPSP